MKQSTPLADKGSRFIKFFPDVLAFEDIKICSYVNVSSTCWPMDSANISS